MRKHVDVRRQRRMLWEEFDGAARRFVLELEAGDDPPIDREEPHGGADHCKERQRDAAVVPRLHCAPFGHRNGVCDRAHRSPRARSAWNCRMENATTMTKSATATVAA